MAVIPFDNPRTPAQRRRRALARGAVRGAAGRLLEKLRLWRQRAQDRAALAALDDRMLADLGISRAEAEFLSNKPFWRK
jgi:uncharacterized protein YjiS (DUF1127 family)